MRFFEPHKEVLKLYMLRRWIEEDGGMRGKDF